MFARKQYYKYKFLKDIAAINRTENTGIIPEITDTTIQNRICRELTRIFLDGPSNNFDMSSLLFLMVKRIFQTITIDSNRSQMGISRIRDQRGLEA